YEEDAFDNFDGIFCVGPYQIKETIEREKKHSLKKKRLFESGYCNFDELGYNILHPQYDVRKFITGNSDIIYTIKDIGTEEDFVFAIRSCKLPAGF
ncbi:MAG: hypothetical protein QF567_03225, partial [Candidatus Pacearchaeota archaeon]|nr:hypothetical protein [Candidatus Pacearchaeota archaeon]